MLGLAGIAASPSPGPARHGSPSKKKKKHKRPAAAGVPSGLRLEQMVQPEGAAAKAKKANKRLSNVIKSTSAFRSAAAAAGFGGVVDLSAALAAPDDSLYDVEKSRFETQQREYYALVEQLKEEKIQLNQAPPIRSPQPQQREPSTAGSVGSPSRNGSRGGVVASPTKSGRASTADFDGSNRRQLERRALRADRRGGVVARRGQTRCRAGCCRCARISRPGGKTNERMPRF